MTRDRLTRDRLTRDRLTRDRLTRILVDNGPFDKGPFDKGMFDENATTAKGNVMVPATGQVWPAKGPPGAPRSTRQLNPRISNYSGPVLKNPAARPPGMRCPKPGDTETSSNTAFSSEGIRRPKNLGHRILVHMAAFAGPLHLIRRSGVEPDTDKPELNRGFCPWQARRAPC